MDWRSVSREQLLAMSPAEQRQYWSNRETDLNGNDSRYATGIGFIDDTTGASQHKAEGDKENERNNQEGWVEDWAESMPGDQDVTPQYQMMDDNLRLGDSQAAQASADPNSIAGQQDALSALQDIYQNKGLTAADRQGIQASQAMNNRAMRSQRDSVMAGLEERGMGGSGAALLGMLSGNSATANANSQAMADINMNAQQRSQNAMIGAGNISTSMREQSFGEDYKKRSAVDAWNQDTMNYRRNIQQQNNQTYNAQQDANVAGKQQTFNNQGRIVDARMGVSNARAGDSDAVIQAANARQGAIAGKVLEYTSGGTAGAAGAAGGGDKIYDDDED